MTDGAIHIAGGMERLRGQVLRRLALLNEVDAALTAEVDAMLPAVMRRVADCWRGIGNKYYNRDGAPYFDGDHSNHFCQFLLIFAQDSAAAGRMGLADKLFALNKMMNGCDIYHGVQLPECFYIDHSVGIVLGRAVYGERFYLSQHCTVGSNPGIEEYPVLGADNYMMAGATVIGKVHTGARVIFAAGSCVKDIAIPDDSIVFGRSPDVTIKNLKSETFKKFTPFKQGI